MPLQIFCDEFGNPSGRLLDPEQPVLVYAFMMLQAPALETVDERVQLLLQEGASSPSEDHSVALLNHQVDEVHQGSTIFFARM